jgi:Protein of unknown function (DUF2947)
MAWRFADPRFNVLPQEDLQQMEDVPPNEAECIWKTHVRVDHLLLLPAGLRDIPLQTIEVDWDNPIVGRTLLSRLGYRQDEKIVFFWGPNTAVRTTWSTFLRYWDDFFYPDDDNNLIIIQGVTRKLLLFDERIAEYRILESGEVVPQ